MELRVLLEAERDSALGQVVGRHLHVHAVAGEDPDSVLAHLAGGVGEYFVVIVQFDPEHRIGEQLGNSPRKFNKVFFRHVASLVHGAALAIGWPRIGRGYKPFSGIPQFPPRSSEFPTKCPIFSGQACWPRGGASGLQQIARAIIRTRSIWTNIPTQVYACAGDGQ